jgi:hypothetical protein
MTQIKLIQDENESDEIGVVSVFRGEVFLESVGIERTASDDTHPTDSKRK